MANTLDITGRAAPAMTVSRGDIELGGRDVGKIILVSVSLFVIVFVRQGGATDPRAASVTTTSLQQAYAIGPEDVLQIVVWNNDTLSRTVPVRPDGMISLPLLDDIQAEGLRPNQLRDVLIKRFGEFLPTPRVSVIVADVRSYRVSVIGEVAKPGQYELKSWRTVLEVLALAGGFTQYSNKNGRMLILRPNGSKMMRIPFNYSKAITAEAEQENFYVRPNDIIIVP